MVAAIADRLRSTGVRFHDARPSTPDYPYVVASFDSGPRRSTRAADVRVESVLSWQTTVVGESAAQCRAAVDRIVDALTDWTPVVDGRVCHKVRHETSRPMARDDDLPNITVLYVIDQWSVKSEPLSA